MFATVRKELCALLDRFPDDAHAVETLARERKLNGRIWESNGEACVYGAVCGARGWALEVIPHRLAVHNYLDGLKVQAFGLTALENFALHASLFHLTRPACWLLARWCRQWQADAIVRAAEAGTAPERTPLFVG